MNIRQIYERRFSSSLQQLAVNIENHLREHVAELPRIDRVSARPKSIDRFVAKSQKQTEGQYKYSDPINQIQDQVGARIITFYPSDVEEVRKIVERYYRPVEYKSHVPDSEWKFGYFGKHYVLLVPDDVLDGVDQNDYPEFFELQIKTLFQHAWSEAEHDLGYKPGTTPLSADQERRLAYAAAQAWGADRLFDELFSERSRGEVRPTCR